jgi:hypothetical protein
MTRAWRREFESAGEFELLQTFIYSHQIVFDSFVAFDFNRDELPRMFFWVHKGWSPQWGMLVWVDLK